MEEEQLDEEELKDDSRVDLAKRTRHRECDTTTYAQRLPFELLAEVFSHVCPLSASTLSIPKRDKYEHPEPKRVSAPSLHLSQVSRHWRTVALSCPRLWTSIEVDLSKISGRYEAVIFTYLKNSASRCLDIKIHDEGIWDRRLDAAYREDHLGENGVAILDTILSQSSRIESLELLGFEADYGLPDYPKCSFPLLRRFKVDMKVKHNDGWLMEPLNEAPFLDTIDIPAPSIHDHALPLPYGQLNYLTIEQFARFPYFDYILSRSSNIQTLKITFYRNCQSALPTRIIVLPTLRSISLIFAQDAPYVALPKLQVPNLYCLEVSCLVRERDWLSSTLVNMLQSCSSSLRRLSVHLPTLYPCMTFAIPRLLDLLPQLTRFDFLADRDKSGRMIRDLLSTITIPSTFIDTSLSIVLPRLSSLSVTIDDGSDLLEEEVGQLIVEMMMSRSRERLLELGKSEIEVAALTHAVFEFGVPQAESGVPRWPGITEGSRSLLEMTNKAQLDPGTVFRVSVSSF